MITSAVAAVIDEVRSGGDAALRNIAARFGDAEPIVVALSDASVVEACARVSVESKDALNFAAANIRTFAQAIFDSVTAQKVDVAFNGYRAGMRFAPVDTVACYVPGGRYSLPSTALMTAITAKVAGVRNVFIVSPVLSDEVLYAGTVSGVTGFIRIGGAQAVAAVAYGTETIPKADMVVGPGNSFVTEAKRQLQGTIGIDMLAGPSEVAIIADDSANAQWLALDMLSQAEHDPEARCYLLTDSTQLADAVRKEISKALGDGSIYPNFIDEQIVRDCVLVEASLAACADKSNEIAPEHLVIAVRDAEALRAELKNYGALFIGQNATVPFGDYAAGPNHTLPTGGSARFSSGLTPLTFLRTQTWLEVDPIKAPTDLVEQTAVFAAIEGLKGHAAAALARRGGPPGPPPFGCNGTR